MAPGAQSARLRRQHFISEKHYERRIIPPSGTLAVAYGRFSTDTQNPRSADDQIAMLCEIASKAG